MTTNNPATAFFMPREMADRRVSTKAELPYMTEEGLILFDRREGSDRRVTPRQQATACSMAQVADPVKLAA